MNLSLISFQYLIPEFDNVEQSIKEYYVDNEFKINSFKTSNVIGDIKMVVVVEDTINDHLIKDLWLYSQDYFYKLSARYLSKYKDVSKYTKMADNFINSFEIVNTDEYWKEKIQNSELDYKHRDLNTPEPKDWDCLVYGKKDQYVFFKGPVFMQDGSFVLIQDIPNRINEKIKYNFLRLNNEIFQYNKTDTTDHFLYVPFETIPNDTFEIEFGYVPEEGIIKECYDFNYQSLKITPPPQKP